MDKEWKEKWIEALRSGKYNQTTGALSDDDGYCCLGILCLIQKQNFQEDFGTMETDNLSCKGYDCGLPYEEAQKLAQMNDDGKTFDHIAGYIQAML